MMTNWSNKKSYYDNVFKIKNSKKILKRKGFRNHSEKSFKTDMHNSRWKWTH